MKYEAISAVLVLYLGLTLGFPLIRHRLKHGRSPVVFQRRADPVQALVGGLFALLLAAGGLWAALLVLLSEQSLGLWPVPQWVSFVGAGMVVTGTAIELVGQLSMGASMRVGIDDRPTALVTSGVFAHVRNPVFSGALLALGGVVLLTPSPWTIVTYCWIAALIAIQVRLEEAHLVRLHGDRYLDYCRRVGRFVPGLGRLRGGVS